MTVGELDSRMTYSERQDWILYVQENGPLNPMLRMEGAIARALLPFLKKGTKLKDLMVWPREQDVEGTPEAVMNFFASVLKSNGKPGKKPKYRRIKNHG